MLVEGFDNYCELEKLLEGLPKEYASGQYGCPTTYAESLRRVDRRLVELGEPCREETMFAVTRTLSLF
jgi:hypothetical protein